jgi:hypothetical protein
MSMDRRSSPVKRWAVKWDETEIPDGEYVSAADYDALVAKTNARVQELQDMNLRFGARIRELEAALRAVKSLINGPKVGTPEYSAMLHINAALDRKGEPDGN